MISNTTQPWQHAARFRMPVGTLAGAGVRCADAALRVLGTRMPADTPATAAVRPYAFGISGVRSWSPPV
jgi:hypothetical protein